MNECMIARRTRSSFYSAKRTFSKVSSGSAPSVAIVTGASRGIGRAIALSLADAGCKVVVNYLNNQDSAEDVVKHILQHAKDKSSDGIAIRADCSKQDEVQNMFNLAIEKFGPIDILVNNAGITRDRLAVTMKPSDFSDVVELNLNGVFYCSQIAFSTSMMRRRRGRIINIASVVGQIGGVGQVNYAAAKGGVLAMTRALAKELAPRHVTVNAVCPGFIQSDMTKDIDKDAILPLIPLKRFGTADEVAGLVRYLALDPSAAYVTGHCFNIDGGLAIGAT